MLPKTKYRKQIELEKCNQCARCLKKLQVFINGKEPWYYVGDAGRVEIHQLGGKPLISIDFIVDSSKVRITATDFIYNTVKNRLDLFVDE